MKKVIEETSNRMTARIDKVTDKLIKKETKQVFAAEMIRNDIAADTTELRKFITKLKVKIIAEKEKNPDVMTASIEVYIKSLDVDFEAINAPFNENVEQCQSKMKQLKEERIEFRKKKNADVDNLKSSLIEAMIVDQD